jgi:putative ABC transport system permease protein
VVRLALRGLLVHRVRLAATAVAVMLGVGFIAGTYVLTDTLRVAVNGLLHQSQANVAVLVQGRSAVSTSPTTFGDNGLTIPQGSVGRVAAVPGVAAADGVVLGPVAVLGPNGKALSATGSLQLAVSVGTVPSLRSLTLRQGRFPTGPDQAVLDVASARRFHIGIGQTIRLAGAGAARRFRVVGLVGYGDADSLAGTTIVGLTLTATQAVLGQPGQIYEVVVASAPGVAASALKTKVAATLGPDFRVRTQQQAIASATSSIDKGFAVFSDVLLVFAGVALFVAIFLIFNTFSILLAQRSKELALLRCLGATRRQLVSTVLAESAVVGVAASAAGLGVGVVLALGIRRLLSSIGIGFPSAAPVVEVRTVVVSLVVGTVATMGAALLPALRGARTSPVAALRDELPVDLGRPAPYRLVAGSVLVLAGVLVVVGALHHGRGQASTRAEVAAFGLVLGFLGLSALVPLVARPLAGVIGWPFAALRGVPGQLGRRNAMRHPRRTATTAAALMIGLTLVTTIAIFARSVQASTDASLEGGLHADVVLTPKGTASLSPSVGERLAALPQLRNVAALSSHQVVIDLAGRRSGGASDRAGATGTDVAAYARDVSIPPTSGSLEAVHGSAVAVTTGIASTWHLRVGSPLPLGSVEVAKRTFTVAAVIHDPTGMTGDILFSTGGLALLFPTGSPSITVVLAQQAPGVGQSTALAAIDRVTSAFPQVRVETKAGFIGAANHQFQQLVGVVTALLGLAVVIALFGIVNTLALSVVERRREIGLLRALGMSRSQLRASVRWEAVVVALLGTVLGIVLGLAFAWVVVDALRSDGITHFSLPVVELVVFVVLAGVAGVVAAIVPARSAARVDVLAAITTE